MNRGELNSYILGLITKNHKGSQKAFAIEHGMSQSYLSDVLNNRREPGKKIMDVVGVERQTVYCVREKEGVRE